MISITKEKDIRKFLARGISERTTAIAIGVSRSTVAAVRKSPEIRTRRNPQLAYEFLKKPIKCSTCGGIISITPCLVCHPEAGFFDEETSKTPPEQKNATKAKKEISELLAIASDILGLYELNLIKHKLFNTLAIRVKKCLDRIPNQKGKK